MHLASRRLLATARKSEAPPRFAFAHAVRRFPFLALAAGFALVGTLGRASGQQLTKPRSMGMGDALRANATGGIGPKLNPSGIAMQRSYMFELDYHFHGGDSIKYFDATVVDSITARLAAALFFNYLSADRDRSGFQTGVSLAFPLLESLFLGVTTKYQDVGLAAPAGSPAGTAGKASGFNADVGGTLRLFNLVSAAVVGMNLVEMNSLEAPRNLGIGFSVQPMGMLLFGFDTVFDFDTARLLGRPNQTEQRYHVGGEVALFGALALRAGYIRDGAYDTSAVTYGATLVAGQFFIDFGARHVLDRSAIFGVGIRLAAQ